MMHFKKIYQILTLLYIISVSYTLYYYLMVNYIHCFENICYIAFFQLSILIYSSVGCEGRCITQRFSQFCSCCLFHVGSILVKFWYFQLMEATGLI